MTNAIQTPMTAAEARTRFDQRVRDTHAVFLKVKDRREYRTLSPRFWVAWLEVEQALRDELTFEEMKPVFKAAYRWLGAPGDFGYDTPQGKGLQGVYWAWNDWCKAAMLQPIAD